MASENRRKKLRRFIQMSNQLTQLLASFCESMSGYAKLLNPKGKLWIVGLLVGALRMLDTPFQLITATNCSREQLFKDLSQGPTHRPPHLDFWI